MANIGLRQAIQSVRDYITEFNDILGNNLDDWRIEETELSEDDKFWLVTISFNRQLSQRESEISALTSGILSTVKPPTIKRDYKIFKVDTQTGEVVSMKIYKL